jgi:hypothetical protein
MKKIQEQLRVAWYTEWSTKGSNLRGIKCTDHFNSFFLFFGVILDLRICIIFQNTLSRDIPCCFDD